jgi:hypothetical protein
VAETATETAKTKGKQKQPPLKQGQAGKKDEIPKAISFFDRMGSIDKADWGTRAKVKIYRLEPLIDQIRISGQKYIAIYEEALTEERIKQDCGSGRYRLYLTFKGPTNEIDKEIDSVELELLDPHYPPKIPAGAWLDDPRNKKWEWARAMLESKTPQPNGASLGGLADTLRAVKEILPVQKGAEEVLNTIRAVKEMTPTPAPATQDATLTAIVELVKAQNLTAQNALAAAQERADKLLFKLLENDNKKTTGFDTFKSVLNEVKEVFGVSALKDLFTVGKDAVSEVAKGRSKMSGWMEFIQPAIPSIAEFLKPFGMAIAQNMIIKAQQQNPPAQPQPPGGTTPQLQPGQQQQQPPPQTSGHESNPGLVAFLSQIAQPLLNYVRMETDNVSELGGDFASWLYDGYGPDPQAMARQVGVQNLIVVLRGTPLWINKGPQNNLPSLAELGPKIEQFLNGFLSWNPPEDEEESNEQGQHVNGAPVDLSAEVFGS